ncbi:Protein of uncharacterised function (DUF551) [Neisseria animaloris]|uniref:DUF551 domain-containing protein n=1 Tax=Neisseria animaloris TaxID=326522 RepID=UPI000A1965B2|nr:DUF551 domain-containing protein [Neisseria animaloris]OSI06801.1 hypothetical protein BWD08_10590 [Neisseria animaloris]VEH86533.1 Protein of uncharacterised function (DUF551) [Neisseria animaloris]
MIPEQLEKEKQAFEEWFNGQIAKDSDFKWEVEQFDARVGWMAAKEQAAKQGGWISIEESTPNPDDTVLLRDFRNNMRSGYLDGDAEAFVYTDSDSWIDDGVITHWQPLPWPPEKE